ncbi:MAG: hypothetical protein DME95_08145 [Verrucomicrobia bacterium]|nr:MAG: hypothetical protein DME95_08145 [Verrucomicrobiota bacterium]
MVMHYQPLWGVREQLFLLCCPETAHRCSQTEVASDSERQAGDQLTLLRLGARSFLSMRF